MTAHPRRTDQRALRDLRYALRAFRREPAFFLGVVGTFAIAIGANAAMFGLVTRLMLAPPPGIREAGTVATVALRYSDGGPAEFVTTTTSYPTLRALREVPLFEHAAAFRPDSMIVGRGPDLHRIGVLAVTGDYFSTLGAAVPIGRGLLADDDLAPAGSPVIVLSHSYWQRVYGGDRSALGREIVLDDQRFTIVGIASRGFHGIDLAPVDAFVPLTAAMQHDFDWMNREGNFLSIVVRLPAGVSASAAQQVASTALREHRDRRDPPAVQLVSILPGRASRSTPQAQLALWLTAVSVIVLFIATANAGTLLSLRAARRRRELATRIALGASSRDLARQLLTESLVLAVSGAAVGLVLSGWFSRIVRLTLLPHLAADETVVNGHVLAASVIAALLAGILAGFAPLLQARHTDLFAELRSAGRGASRPLTFQNTLVTVQVALSMLLLVGAALFVQSLRRVQAQDLGLSIGDVLYVSFDFRGYVAGVERDLAYQEAADRLRTLPRIVAATVAAGIPFGPHHIPPISAPGLQWPPDGSVQIPIMYGATPDYLAILGVRLVAGRSFADAAGSGGAPAVLVNESMARGLWPDRSPLGQCIRIGHGDGPVPDDVNPADAQPCRYVVGVVRDSRARSLRPDANEDRLMQYYVPFEQVPYPPIPDPSRVMGLLVQVQGDVDAMAPVVQRALQSTSAIPVFARVRPYQDLLDPQLRSWRLGATLFSAFGVIALIIASIGLFGIVSYVATQRTQEMGVRLALGGTRADVARLVVVDALRRLALGVFVGVLASLAAGRALAALLFQTSPYEPASVAVAASILLVVTLVAAAWPAWRAGRVNPVVALRADG